MSIQVLFRAETAFQTALQRGIEVIRTEADALSHLAETLDESFVNACRAVLAVSGRVVITGMGKSGHIGRKWAATLAATGTPAFYVHPGEAAHGDLGMLVPDDLLVVLSNSGNTSELRAILTYARTIGVKVIGVAAKPDSLVIKSADIAICLPPTREACPANIAPTTSTTLQLALGDALALTVMDMRGCSVELLKSLHPGGSLGLRLSTIREVMHTAPLPLVKADARMCDVIVTMTSSGFGIAGVVDFAGRLAGVITDGDIRRHFDELNSATAGEVMTSEPRTLSAGMLADEALQFLNANQITCAFVIEPGAAVNAAAPVGIVHVHDLLRAGMR